MEAKAVERIEVARSDSHLGVRDLVVVTRDDLLLQRLNTRTRAHAAARVNRLRLLAVALSVVAAQAAPAGAQPQRPAAEAQEPAPEGAEPGSELTVYLMTIGQGDAVWERFGHNAIWVHDAARGTDVAYNYGIFVFSPGFYSRFLRGDMMYRMEPTDGPASLRHYAESNRSVWLQELNLSPAQRLKLLDFLEWNARDENKFYAYDYFRDNCSTRVRDALDVALDGALREAMTGKPTETTYRSHSLRLTAPQIATSTGLLLGLGPFADRPIDAWDEGFIPMRLMDHVRDVRVERPDGTTEPLVRSERVLFQATRPPAPDRPPQRTLAHLVIGLLLGGALVLLGRSAAGLPATARDSGSGNAGSTKQRSAAAGFLALAVVWSLASGFFGVVLAGLWAFTSHVATYYNENVFQVNPLSFVLAVMLPFARRPAVLRTAAIVAAVIAMVSVIGLLIQLVPGFDQVNGGIIALALSPNLALAWTLAWMSTHHARAGRNAANRGARATRAPGTARTEAAEPAGS